LYGWPNLFGRSFYSGHPSYAGRLRTSAALAGV
jgi:hypothetical protein